MTPLCVDVDKNEQRTCVEEVKNKTKTSSRNTRQHNILQIKTMESVANDGNQPLASFQQSNWKLTDKSCPNICQTSISYRKQIFSRFHSVFKMSLHLENMEQVVIGQILLELVGEILGMENF